MDVLLNIESVTSDSNLRALRQLYDTIESQVRGLKSLGVIWKSPVLSIAEQTSPRDLTAYELEGWR